MADLEAFEAQVNENIKRLSAPDARTRRKAAAWLGEAGDPSAITKLRQVYKEDPDARVREAAAYSLGMFRALEAALADPDREAETLDRLEAIAGGRMGGRVPIPVSVVAKILFGLLVSVLILLAFNFLIWPELEANPPPAQATGRDPVTEGEDTELTQAAADLLALIRNDTTTLLTQYQSAIGGAAVDCTAFFVNPEPFPIDATSASTDQLAVLRDLNTLLGQLQEAKAAYTAACAPGGEPVDAAAAGAAISTLNNDVLPGLETAADQIDQAEAVEEAAAPDPTTADPAEPTVEPTATAVTGADPREHLVALYDLLDEVRGARGSYTLLSQYWRDVRSTGTTTGCEQPRPAIPANYDLPEAVSEPQLRQGAELVNTGLALLRQGWSQFEASCAAGTLAADLETNQQVVQGANTAFQLAQNQFDLLR